MTLDELKDNINELIDYNWSDELHDYKVTVGERGENPDAAHIFHVLVELDNFIKGTSMTAEQHISGEYGARS